MKTIKYKEGDIIILKDGREFTLVKDAYHNNGIWDIADVGRIAEQVVKVKRHESFDVPDGTNVSYSNLAYLQRLKARLLTIASGKQSSILKESIIEGVTAIADMSREIESLRSELSKSHQHHAPVMPQGLDRDDLLNLCKSLSPPYGGDEYSEFCGNQWNEDWRWKDSAFDDMDNNQLWAFYQGRKSA